LQVLLIVGLPWIGYANRTRRLRRTYSQEARSIRLLIRPERLPMLE